MKSYRETKKRPKEDERISKSKYVVKASASGAGYSSDEASVHSSSTVEKDITTQAKELGLWTDK